MIPKSGYRFSEKIMLHQYAGAVSVSSQYETALDVDPIQRLFALDVLQSLEHRLHLGAIALGGHQHELFLELRLIEGALRGSFESRDASRNLAPVLERDGDGGGR